MTKKGNAEGAGDLSERSRAQGCSQWWNRGQKAVQREGRMRR